MDGRGVDAVILSSPPSLAHYGGMADSRPCLLVVTAREAQPVGPDGDIWAEAASLLPHGCALGHEDDVPEAALRKLEALFRPRRMLSISADLARQIAGW